MKKIKKIVDLSWEFTADTPIYPGDPEPSVTVATTLEKEGYNLSTLVMGTQTGTHVDAPYHFSNTGETIDNMELDFFLGDAVVVHVTEKKADEAITMEDIVESNRIKKEAIENLRRDLQGTLSQTQLDKLEEIFLSCSEGYIFRRKGNK